MKERLFTETGDIKELNARDIMLLRKCKCIFTKWFSGKTISLKRG